MKHQGMHKSFRFSMAWLHTWLGLVLGYVLMVCFFFGTLSVFDREIDRWAIPASRFNAQPMPSFDRVLLPVFSRIQPDQADYDARIQQLHDPAQGPVPVREALVADRYWAYTTHRDSILGMGVRFQDSAAREAMRAMRIRGDVTLDPRDGRVLPDDALRIGSRWFYPLHYSLQWTWKNLGYWVVGLAGFTMLVGLVTGLVLHRKIWRELFMFRPWHRTQRSLLDLHNMTGVLALPFHFFFAFTGLVIFAGSIYFPVTQTMLKPIHDQQHMLEAQASGLPSGRAGTPARLASVDAMVAEAKRRWAARDMAGEVGWLVVHHVGDANSYVSIFRAGSDRVALVGEGIHFKGSTGEVLHEDPPHGFASGLGEFLQGLHLQHFEHWLLRWLYVFGGLMGCACIATGFVFFVEKRKQAHARSGSQGSRVVDALAVTTVTGMVIATLAMLVANRCLPEGLTGKDGLEKLVFWSAWGLALAHAFARGAVVARAGVNPAWREQSRLIALLAVMAVVLNAITTGDHLVKTLILAPYWPVAGVDLSLLALAGAALLAARALAPRMPVTRRISAGSEPA